MSKGIYLLKRDCDMSDPRSFVLRGITRESFRSLMFHREDFAWDGEFQLLDMGIGRGWIVNDYMAERLR